MMEAEKPVVEFTNATVERVKMLAEKEGEAHPKLRLFVQGGGCSGLQYGFVFEEEAEDGDLVVEQDGVVFLIDPMSLQYLMGAKVDFRENLEGSTFVITNPNATRTCGCGSSFI